jgi:RNA polymerase sigma-70 factor (ECF subfamily)
LEDTPELYLFGQAAAHGWLEQSESPADDLLSRLEAEQVVEAVETLPEDYRVVATLYFVNDMTYTEIAASLMIPVGTVRSRLHRGRRLLGRMLWRMAEDRGHRPSRAGVHE